MSLFITGSMGALFIIFLISISIKLIRIEKEVSDLSLFLEKRIASRLSGN